VVAGSPSRTILAEALGENFYVLSLPRLCDFLHEGFWSLLAAISTFSHFFALLWSFISDRLQRMRRKTELIL